MSWTGCVGCDSDDFFHVERPCMNRFSVTIDLILTRSLLDPGSDLGSSKLKFGVWDLGLGGLPLADALHAYLSCGDGCL